MRYHSHNSADQSNLTDVRAIAKKALLQLLQPLAGFVLDSGLSAGELHSIFKEAAVRSAASKQLETSDRVNISGIAATTGISRAEISRILKITTNTEAKKNDEGQQQSTNRILAAWHADPKFTGTDGKPADLKLYGRSVSFDSLAKKYGRGIPTRAVLDELVRVGAVELLSNQKIRAVTAMAIDRGMSPRAIEAFGNRAAELLSTMLLNMRQPGAPKFIASISEPSVLISSLPLLKKELSSKGADFLAEIRESWIRTPDAKPLRSRKSKSTQVSVTIFYHESTLENNKIGSLNKRRNFRREA